MDVLGLSTGLTLCSYNYNNMFLDLLPLCHPLDIIILATGTRVNKTVEDAKSKKVTQRKHNIFFHCFIISVY